jgi:ABC-type nitrate/sulfonate/bicarbonate transport system permease component
VLKGILTPFAPLRARDSLLLFIFWTAVIFLVWTLFHGSAIPSPTKTFDALWYLITVRHILPEIWTSLVLSVMGLIIASAIALPICYLMPAPAVRPFTGVTSLLRYAGFTGLAFTFALMIPDEHLRKYMIVVFTMVPWLVTSLSRSIQSIEDEEFRHARSMKMGDLETTWEVIIRGHLPEAIDAIRQNLAIAWAMVAVAESVDMHEGGIGTMLVMEQKLSKVDEIFATLFIILVLGLIQDGLLQLLRFWLCPYASLNQRSM